MHRVFVCVCVCVCTVFLRNQTNSSTTICVSSYYLYSATLQEIFHVSWRFALAKFDQVARSSTFLKLDCNVCKPCRLMLLSATHTRPPHTHTLTHTHTHTHTHSVCIMHACATRFDDVPRASSLRTHRRVAEGLIH